MPFHHLSVNTNPALVRLRIAQFIDTLRHWIERAFAPAQPVPSPPDSATVAAAAATGESGIPASVPTPSIAPSASPVLGMRAFTSPLSALALRIDRLYHQQDRRRPLSAAGYKYLKDLLARGDAVLEVAFAVYREAAATATTTATSAEAEGASELMAAAEAEFNDTLLHLASRWRRELTSVGETDCLQYV